MKRRTCLRNLRISQCLNGVSANGKHFFVWSGIDFTGCLMPWGQVYQLYGENYHYGAGIKSYHYYYQGNPVLLMMP